MGYFYYSMELQAGGNGMGDGESSHQAKPPDMGHAALKANRRKPR